MDAHAQYAIKYQVLLGIYWYISNKYRREFCVVLGNFTPLRMNSAHFPRFTPEFKCRGRFNP